MGATFAALRAARLLGASLPLLPAILATVIDEVVIPPSASAPTATTASAAAGGRPLA